MAAALRVAALLLALSACAPVPQGSPMADGPAVAAPSGCRDYMRTHPEDVRC